MAKADARKPGLELDDDPVFQARFWRAERIAWTVFGLIVIAALLGLTGRGGPLARATIENAAASVDYPRITRWESPEEVEIRATGGGSVAVELDQAFADAFEVTSVTPRPVASSANPDGLRLVFDLGAGAGERSIVLGVKARRPAIPLTGRLRVGEGPPLVVRPVILP